MDPALIAVLGSVFAPIFVGMAGAIAYLYKGQQKECHEWKVLALEGLNRGQRAVALSEHVLGVVKEVVP